MFNSWKPYQIFDPAYGSFSFVSTLVVAGSNIPTPIPQSITEISQGTFLLPPLPSSKVTVQETGIYKFSYSLQFSKSGGNPSICDIWIRVNGVDVPRSSSQIVVSGNNGETFPYCEYILSLKANDYIETYFQSPDTSMMALYISTIGIPVVPSIITNIIRIA